MKEIREWLASQGSYALGVALYETHGKSQVVLKSLRYGETEFTRSTLRRELEKIVAGAVTATCVRAVDPFAERVRETATGVHVAPPAHPERPTWYAARAYAHAQLELVATDADRRQLAADILGLSEKIDASYRPPVLAEAALPPAAGEPRQRLTNLRSLRSKLKHRPDRASDLARITQEITLLEEKLKNRDGESQLHLRD